MAEVGAYEAKTHFSRLLERVERGERITLTRHGREVAVLIPAGGGREPSEVVEELREFRRGRRFEGDLESAIEEGRL